MSINIKKDIAIMPILKFEDEGEDGRPGQRGNEIGFGCFELGLRVE
jgi:hypothetical protein